MELETKFDTEVVERAAEIYNNPETNTVKDVARLMGMSKTAARARLREATALGKCKLRGRGRRKKPDWETIRRTRNGEGEVTQEIQRRVSLLDKEPPEGLEQVGRTVLFDDQGNPILEWKKYLKAKNFVDWEAVFEAAFKDYERPLFNITPIGTPDEHKINVFPCNDWHVNMLCWKREVAVNWDLKIAEKVLGDTIDATVARAPRAKLGIVLGGGDLMHNDDNTNRTAKSHNLLDCDGRFEKGLEVAQRLKVRAIDAMLFKHDEVLVVVLKGNHDEQASIAIKHYLKAWYKNEPRVKVEMSSALLWEYDQGKVMLAATHGHAMKMRQLPQVVADRFSEAWGRTKKRYAHTFHVHHKDLVTSEGGGIIVESHQAPIPQDAWHYGEGFLSGRSMQIITYDDRYGETGRVTEAVMDG